ncbi:23S rRNA (cytidine1920-2'-O)/16S rRNA (cytidine1409-2'-O)-methyltransferase [Desulfurobacterium pacificum]|uniref:23S rRNA (Cytidine1920-2'-O)/16S rRNA (Cytidine1409-2'-O)-methyltransferase n=1 Tax=Desulfurobacterium pacificum TaxID=240166 RepID=A0ABY1NVR9_9BACT|nr:TlyA family RNA methyltransferase [Desulfurobacterium pacificum]SMP19537.1 23S rRNA (cytidine1920-2'-O)/16S rRNA (cytidine1409-2'-O)-methyltransferase [Desulfurobacterium pacificum]
MKKERIDKLLVEKGLVKSRERAKALIMAGKVKVNGQVVDKPGTSVPADSVIEVKEEDIPYVSRGGLKLETALKEFGVDVSGFVCLDVGASTGGFTDCLLQHGAKKVYAVDVGRGQLDWKLRNDPRVISIERFNARYLTEKEIPEKVDLVVMDVSFISVTKLLPVVKQFLKPEGKMIVLIKPQFELTKREVDRGKGVIRDPELHKKAINKVLEFARSIGLYPEKLTLSKPRGPKGNKEFLVLLSQKEGDDRVDASFVDRVVKVDD